MRDVSTDHRFTVGDSVLVAKGVLKTGVNLKGRTGEVVETSCDANPDPCCAEQRADLDTAVRVRFEGDDPSGSSKSSGDDVFVTDHYFLHCFAEDELLLESAVAAAAAATAPVVEKEVGTSNSDNNSVAFDGLSCKAFKLERLGTGRPRTIASFEPSRDALPAVDADNE